jgi:hypothetical protein
MKKYKEDIVVRSFEGTVRINIFEDSKKTTESDLIDLTLTTLKNFSRAISHLNNIKIETAFDYDEELEANGIDRELFYDAVTNAI